MRLNATTDGTDPSMVGLITCCNTLGVAEDGMSNAEVVRAVQTMGENAN